MTGMDKQCQRLEDEYYRRDHQLMLAFHHMVDYIRRCSIIITEGYHYHVGVVHDHRVESMSIIKGSYQGVTQPAAVASCEEDAYKVRMSASICNM